MGAVSLDEKYVGDTSTDDDYIKDNVEKSRASISKLCVKVDNVTEMKLAVAFTVIATAEDIPARGTVYAWKNIADWKSE